ncbi:zinc finger protein 407-like [Ostrea edulis]|uniref:zinc finger protein 407-like n=1 Tax=Ostrea edulis TaxID=37623 RepID=UPI0024AEBA2A|nr:zinc finger protein 407-like [Ostrea edulis]
MPLTKLTPRKPGFLCSICLVRLPSKDEWSNHLLACGLADMNKRKFECDLCDQAFGKKVILTRHIKRVHPSVEKIKAAIPEQVESTPKPSQQEEEWDKNPGELIFDDADLEVGRTQRKRTTPRSPGVKRKDKEIETENETEISEPDSQEAPLEYHHCSCCKNARKERIDTGTQTNVKLDEEKKTGHQKIIRVIRRYQEKGESVEKFEEDVWYD